MSSPNEADLQTPSRVRVTRNRSTTETPTKVPTLDEDDSQSDEFPEDDDEDENPARRKRAANPHKPVGSTRVDSSLTAALRPVFEGIYDLRDEE